MAHGSRSDQEERELAERNQRSQATPPINEAAERRYMAAIDGLDEVVSQATRASQAIAGRQVDQRRWWASILFTRLCTTCVSILCLTPRSRFSGGIIEHFDFSAVASLTRNLVECYFAFFYLCVDTATDDEWHTRLNLLQLHDCMERYKMFRDFDESDEQLALFNAQAEELREKLRKRRYFSLLDSKQQKRLLTGSRPWLLSQDELVTELGMNVGEFRGLYRFLSSHAHSFPLAFYRMGERNQGRGVGSEWEKTYISHALEFAESIVRRGINDVVKLFPDVTP